MNTTNNNTICERLPICNLLRERIKELKEDA
jgi:hypothetical protein